MNVHPNSFYWQSYSCHPHFRPWNFHNLNGDLWVKVEVSFHFEGCSNFYAWYRSVWWLKVSLASSSQLLEYYRCPAPSGSDHWIYHRKLNILLALTICWVSLCSPDARCDWRVLASSSELKCRLDLFVVEEEWGGGSEGSDRSLRRLTTSVVITWANCLLLESLFAAWPSRGSATGNSRCREGVIWDILANRSERICRENDKGSIAFF